MRRFFIFTAMQTFLDDVLNQFALRPDSQWANTIIVLPSKRAGSFFKYLFKTKLRYNGFTPEVWSIEEFIAEITQLKLLDNTRSLFKFYQTYITLTDKVDQEDFDTFYGWAQTLIYDFNEIDRYNITTEKFYNYLGDVQTIEHWSIAQPQTEMVKNYLKFWKRLPEYHTHFVHSILAQKEAYQGLMYRRAAAEISTYLSRTDKQITFAGFNALNASEQIIIQKILEAKRGEVFWDIDHYFFSDPQHDAGLFLRQHFHKWPYYSQSKADFNWLQKHYTQPKNITCIGLPKNIGQIKYVGRLLETVDLNNTAVVLNDEGLLLPLLNSLPSNVTKANVTMGLPLAQTPLASLFELIFKIQSEDLSRIYYKNVLELINHPSIRLIIDNTDEHLQEHIISKNLVFLTAEQILKLAADQSRPLLKLCLTDYTSDIHRFTTAMIELTEILRPQNQSEYAIETEYIFHFNRLFKKIKNLLTDNNPIQSIQALGRIYQDTLKTETIDFSGSPHQGLQIMGMLETRVLDYDTVILTSVNEGVLPGGKSANSFIPYDLKKMYGLPTYKEKDAIYAYHFYRLLQRAKNVYLLYDSDESSNGEPSRFITQIQVDNLPQHQLKSIFIQPNTKTISIDAPVITKTEKVLDILKKQAAKGFSPSALTSYIRNPLDFYKQYVLGIRDEEEVEETIAANTLGTIVHDTLENFYKPFEGRALTSADVKKMEPKIAAEVLTQFHKTYGKSAPITTGKNLITFEVAKRYVANFLKSELKLLQKHKLEILHIESDALHRPIELPELDFPVAIRGRVDRVDCLDGLIRIVDYKTGKVETKHLNLKDWDELIADYKFSKAFQVLTYASMLQHSKNYKHVEAGIISFKNLKAGFMPFTLVEKDEDNKTKKSSEIDQNLLDLFHDKLKTLICEIFNPDVPFIEKEV